MFYQLLHTGCILKTLPGRFGFLFWHQRFSSSDPINQCAAPGFRHGERGPVVLMLNVYFFSPSFLFSFFLPHPPSSFKDLLSSLFKTYRLNTGGWIFQWGQTWDICHWNIDDQPCANKKKGKKKKAAGSNPLWSSACLPVSKQVGRISPAQPVGHNYVLQEWPVLLTDQATAGGWGQIEDENHPLVKRSNPMKCLLKSLKSCLMFSKVHIKNGKNCEKKMEFITPAAHHTEQQTWMCCLMQLFYYYY